MKKVVSYMLLCSLLFSMLILPASAAEPEEYVFEYFEMPALYAEYPFEFDENYTYFVMEGYLPEGSYCIEILNGDYPNGVSAFFYAEIHDIFDVHYYLNSGILVTEFDGCLSLYYMSGQPFETHNATFYLAFVDGLTFFGVAGINSLSAFSFIQQVKFIPYDKVYEGILSVTSAMRSNLQDLTGMNLTTIILAGLGIAAAPVIAWYGYRFIKCKAASAFKKGKF